MLTFKYYVRKGFETIPKEKFNKKRRKK